MLTWAFRRVALTLELQLWGPSISPHHLWGVPHPDLCTQTGLQSLEPRTCLGCKNQEVQVNHHGFRALVGETSCPRGPQLNLSLNTLNTSVSALLVCSLLLPHWGKLEEKIPVFHQKRWKLWLHCTCLVTVETACSWVCVLTQGLSGPEDGWAEAVFSSSMDAGEDAESHGGSEGGRPLTTSPLLLALIIIHFNYRSRKQLS